MSDQLKFEAPLPPDLARLAVPPLYELLADGELLLGEHIHKAWRSLAREQGSRSTGVPVIFKFLESETAFATEIACGLAALALKLSVPEPAIVSCPGKMLGELPARLRSRPEIWCFGSLMKFEEAVMMRLRAGNPLAEEYVWSQYCGSGSAAFGAAWDELIANGDRHYQNIMFDGGIWWLFDHEKSLSSVNEEMKKFVEALSRQVILEHVAEQNQIADQLKQRRPNDHKMEEAPKSFLRSMERVRMLAEAVRGWSEPAALRPTYQLVEVILRSIHTRLPALADHLKARLDSQARLQWNSTARPTA